MKRILFLCADNRVLSPMAQALARLYAQAGTLTYSAGLSAADAFEPRLMAMLGELDLAPRCSAPQSLAKHADLSFDCCVWLGPQPPPASGLNLDVQWTTTDPSDLSDAAYRHFRDRLAERVRHLVQMFEADLD